MTESSKRGSSAHSATKGAKKRGKKGARKKAPARKKSLSYKDAGVDIDAGNRLVELIRPAVQRTRRAEVLGSIGGFGGLCTVPAGYRNPVLVAGTDGVGTKIELARRLNRHDTIGIDLVAMCVNDILVLGAEPLFFLDYYVTGRLDPEQAAQVINGIAEGCEEAGAALLGGETAEHPGVQAEGEYDLAGFCVGVVEKDGIINGVTIQKGDAVIGVASSGPHSNGYSLIRKILEISKVDLDADFDIRSVGEALLEPTTIYVKPLLPMCRQGLVKGLAHITGGGIIENLARVIPDRCRARLVETSWDRPDIFNWLQESGNLADAEMWRTFNCGIGMALVVAEENVTPLLNHFKGHALPAWQIGRIEPADEGSAKVVIE